MTEVEVYAAKSKYCCTHHNAFASIGSNRFSLGVILRLNICVTLMSVYMYYAMFSSAYGDIHADVIQKEICAVQVAILMYT